MNGSMAFRELASAANPTLAELRAMLDSEIADLEGRLDGLRAMRAAAVAFAADYLPAFPPPVSGRVTFTGDVVRVFESRPLEVLDVDDVMDGLRWLGREPSRVGVGNAIQYAIRLGKVDVVHRGGYVLGRSAGYHGPILKRARCAQRVRAGLHRYESGGRAEFQLGQGV